MSKVDKIKYMTTMSKQITRKRDGQTDTHFLRVQLSRDEALAVSAAIAAIHQADPEAPTFTLIRDFCLSLTDHRLDEAKLVEDMAKWRTRAMLAQELAEADYQVAISRLATYKEERAAKAIRREESEARKQKPSPAPVVKPQAAVAPPTAPKVRREFVPEPKTH
jgi:hypothetical protein